MVDLKDKLKPTFENLGYLKDLVPTEAPEESEDWKDIMKGNSKLVSKSHYSKK